MNAPARYLIVVLALAAIAADGAVGEVRVVAQVDTSKDIYVGESFVYNIIIDGEDKPGDVDLTPLAKCGPRSAGNRDVSQTSIRFDGRTTHKTVIKRYVMSYHLTCQERGRIQLPPVTVTIEGERYQTNPVEVNILKPGTTDKLELELILSEQRCYVGQPVVMTVNFYVSADIGDFELNVPVFSSDDFDFADPDFAGPAAKPYRLSSTMSEPVYVTQDRVVRKGRSATLLSFSKVLLARRPGRTEIAPITVSADVVVGQSRSFFGFDRRYQRFMASSKSATLTVLPLPAQGKPGQFYGLVGRYTVSASATPTKVSVGDPITLTIKIGGSRYLKPVRWPALEQIPELAGKFKIPSEESQPELQEGFKVFTQTIRANNDKVTEIPPIPLAFFDAENGRYEVATSEPIKLDVAPAKKLTGADLEGGDFVPLNREVEAIKKGLAANYERLDALEDTSFSPVAAALSPVYAAVWAGPLGVFVLSVLARVLTRASPERIAQRRRRQACGRALKQLRNVDAARDERRQDLIVSAMKQYVGERFDRVAGSLTADDCRDIIVGATEDVGTGDKYRDIIIECEAARYASVETTVDAARFKQVVELICSIEKKSRRWRSEISQLS